MQICNKKSIFHTYFSYDAKKDGKKRKRKISITDATVVVVARESVDMIIIIDWTLVTAQ